MIYNSTDYVKEIKLQVKNLIEKEFIDVIVYLADSSNIAEYGVGGTFCIEGAASGVSVAQKPGQVHITLRIWTYFNEVDNELAEEQVSQLAQKLEGLLVAYSSNSPNSASDIVASDFIQTTYLTREKGRTLRRKYLRAARTDWRVRLAATR